MITNRKYDRARYGIPGLKGLHSSRCVSAVGHHLEELYMPVISARMDAILNIFKFNNKTCSKCLRFENILENIMTCKLNMG